MYGRRGKNLFKSFKADPFIWATNVYGEVYFRNIVGC